MVIIDVAALDVVDSFAANILSSCATIARLRGAQLTVVGIQPDVALTMAEIGLNTGPRAHRPRPGRRHSQTLDHCGARTICKALISDERISPQGRERFALLVPGLNRDPSHGEQAG